MTKNLAVCLSLFFTACGGATIEPTPDAGFINPAPDAEPRADAGANNNADAGTSLRCGSRSAATGFQPTREIISNGVRRTYSLNVPTSYDPSQDYPLIFVFHGDGSSGAAIRAALDIETPAANRAIFVYPDATEASGRSFDIEAPYDRNADMQLFTDLIDQLEADYCVDRSRVFAAGHSRGAFFVNFLNCRLGTNVLRAIAPHSGSGPYGAAGEYDGDGHFMCQAPAAAAMLIHGSVDEVVPLSDADYSHYQWSWANGCNPDTIEYSVDPCRQDQTCAAGKPVVWCGIPGLGHEIWSGAGAAIWFFFSSLD